LLAVTSPREGAPFPRRAFFFGATKSAQEIASTSQGERDRAAFHRATTLTSSEQQNSPAMKSLRLLALASVLTGSALIAAAGQTSQLFRPGPAPEPAKKATAPAAVACPSCKNEAVYATRFVGPVNRQHVQSVQVATKHSCAACGAAVAAAHNCANEKTPGASCCTARS
jgi:hypothetical protein